MCDTLVGVLLDHLSPNARQQRPRATGSKCKQSGIAGSAACGVRRSCHGRPVNTPPKKKLNPKTQSQWGQEYMTSFFTVPTTSLRTGRESGEEAAFSFRVTGFLQCGHFAIVCSPIFRRCVESMCVSPNDHHQRCEPAAEGSPIGTELNGWLASAAWCGWALWSLAFFGDKAQLGEHCLTKAEKLGILARATGDGR
jgi:hypothetical protein